MKSLFLPCFLFASFACLAQGELFSGVVVYKPANDDRGITEPLLPDEVVVYSAPGFHRYEEAVGEERRVVIFDLSSHRQYTLMNLLGEDIAIQAELQERALSATMGNNHNEALPICGWTTKSAMIDDQIVVYTPQLLNDHPMLPPSEGLVLEYTYPKSSLRLRAVSVSTSPPDENLFEIPEGYSVITADELLDVFGIETE